jgi:hypothetical protein
VPAALKKLAISFLHADGHPSIAFPLGSLSAALIAAMSRLVYVLDAAPQHQFPNHPECPQRVTAIEEALQQLEVFQGCGEGQVRMGRLP